LASAATIDEPFDVGAFLDQLLEQPLDLGYLDQLPDPEPLGLEITATTTIEVTHEEAQDSEPVFEFQTIVGSDISPVEGMDVDFVDEASTQTDLPVP
jgi:hypothetical protein